MLYRILNRMVEHGQTAGMDEKLGVFYAAGKLTREEYEQLSIKLHRSEIA